ncbi:MAG: CoA pyrophosphatase [Myxococcales bacterium]|nr:CoA pyrophosphatase [Myxococcales bacterium]MDH3482642.1 CoA pyrophosphatase [Myxococcales bacterium]
MPIRPLDLALRNQMARNLAAHTRAANRDPCLTHAAVAVALVAGQAGEAAFVITRRADSLRNHSGQWALPGGSLDEGETVTTAALRELGEEVGLQCTPDQVLGLLDGYPTRSGFLITPVVVWAGADAVLSPNPDEVAEAHRVRLADLDLPGVPRLFDIPESDRPVISVPLLGDFIFAPTAAILFQLREVALYGRETRVAQYDQPVFAWR